MKIHLADMFYVFRESTPSIFPLHFRYIYLSLYIFIKSKLLAGSIPVLNLTKKCIILSSRNISVIYYILFTLNFRKDMAHFSQTEFSVLILLILLLKNQEHSLTFSMCEHRLSILSWQQFLMPHFVSIACNILIFSDQWVRSWILKRIFKIQFSFCIWI